MMKSRETALKEAKYQRVLPIDIAKTDSPSNRPATRPCGAFLEVRQTIHWTTWVDHIPNRIWNSWTVLTDPQKTYSVARRTIRYLKKSLSIFATLGS